MDQHRAWCTKEMAILGVVVVNAGTYLFWRIVRRRAPAIFGRAFLGFYFVLMPLGFLVWWSWWDLTLWTALVLAIAGLTVLARRVRLAS